MAELMLKIVTPEGAHGPVPCDSIHLTVSDTPQGKSGGSYGIRPGHTKAILTLDAGGITAFLAGEPVLSGRCSRGFATVEQNTVTAVLEDFLDTKHP